MESEVSAGIKLRNKFFNVLVKAPRSKGISTVYFLVEKKKGKQTFVETFVVVQQDCAHKWLCLHFKEICRS